MEKQHSDAKLILWGVFVAFKTHVHFEVHRNLHKILL